MKDVFNIFIHNWPSCITITIAFVAFYQSVENFRIYKIPGFFFISIYSWLYIILELEWVISNQTESIGDFRSLLWSISETSAFIGFLIISNYLRKFVRANNKAGNLEP